MNNYDFHPEVRDIDTNLGIAWNIEHGEVSVRDEVVRANTVPIPTYEEYTDPLAVQLARMLSVNGALGTYES